LTVRRLRPCPTTISWCLRLYQRTCHSPRSKISWQRTSGFSFAHQAKSVQMSSGGCASNISRILILRRLLMTVNWMFSTRRI
jgi:hypothetical protein